MLIFVTVFAQFCKISSGVSLSPGNDGKTVHKVDNWHLRQQSSMSESNSSLLHKSIFIKVLSSLSEILRVSFSPPTLAQIRECTFFLGHIYSSHPNPHLFINGIASLLYLLDKIL
jgi:hypothetical protein